MPWTKRDVESHKKGLTDEQKGRWVAIANNVLKTCLAGGEGQSECEGRAVRIANAKCMQENEEEPMDDELNVEEAKKKIGPEYFGPGDFLVVEDPQKPTTWHLQVRKHGKPDHKLMGGAWAALTAPEGHRGNKYAGPNKAEALRKLKALYKSEKMPTPGSKAKECMTEAELEELDRSLVEYLDYEPEFSYYPTYGATSFGDLVTAENASESMRKVGKYTGQLSRLVDNIMYSQEISDKYIAIKAVADEYVSLVQEAMGRIGEEPTTEIESAAVEKSDSQLAESFAGSALDVLEEGDKGDVLRMKVRLIKPGWGNAKDNNYYSAEMLKQHTQIFVGTKMYETDHKPDEKSTRTWVSTVENVESDAEGAPVATVVIHDPNFAERTRNLAKAKHLDKLECSILASGKVRKGEIIDGKKGNVVESIESVSSVDWVTRAGAGGQALQIEEVDKVQPSDQVDRTDKVDDNGTEQDTQSGSEEQAQENAQQTVEQTVEQDAKPVMLAEADVLTALGKTNLPEAARNRLSEREWPTVDALQEAIMQEVAYIKAITGSGKPREMGEGDKPNRQTLREQGEKLLSQVAEKYL